MTSFKEEKSQVFDEANLSTVDNNCEENICQLETCNHKIPQIEDFIFIKPISRGAFGKVFLGHKKGRPDKIYAIKVMKKDYMVNKNLVRQVITERNALAVSRSPFIVQLYYSLQTQKNIYLVMEYMIGGDMKNLLAVCGYFDETMALTYIAEVILALKFLHSLGIIHRDLKPDNMLISDKGHIKLTDLGLCEITIDTKRFDGSQNQEWLMKCHLTPGQILSLTSSLGFSNQKSKIKPSNFTPSEDCDSSTQTNLSHNDLRRFSSATQQFHVVPPVRRLKDVLGSQEASGKSFCSLLDHTIEKSFSDSGHELNDDVFNSPNFSFKQSYPRTDTPNLEPESASDIENCHKEANKSDTMALAEKSHLGLAERSHYLSMTEDSFFLSPKDQRDSQLFHQTGQSFSLTHSDISPNLGFLHRSRHSRKRKMSHENLASDHEKSASMDLHRVPLKNKVHFNNMSSTPLSAKLQSSRNFNLGIKKKLNKFHRRKQRRQKFCSRLKQVFEISPKSPNPRSRTRLTEELDCLDLGGDQINKKARLSKTPQRNANADVSQASSYFSAEENLDDSHSDNSHQEAESSSSKIYPPPPPPQKCIQFSETLLRHEYKSMASLESDNKSFFSPSLNSGGHSLKLNIPSSLMSSHHFNSYPSTSDSALIKRKTNENMTPDTMKRQFRKSPFHTPSWCQKTPLRTPKSVRRCQTQGPGERVLGTPDYLAPEILLQQKHDEAVDWWALGVCMFEFLTGVPPFNDSTPEKVFQNILNRDIPWPEGEESLSESSCFAIEALLTMDPLNRPKSKELMKMQAFTEIHWDQLLNEPAPFQPQPSDETDTSYFDVRNNLQSLVVSSVDL